MPQAADRMATPFDLDAMLADGDWQTWYGWPVSMTELDRLQTAWRRALLDFMIAAPSGLLQDTALLSFGPVLSRTIPLTESAQCLDLADQRGFEMLGGPPEVDYLRGERAGDDIPDDTTPHIKPIISARHPLVRGILTTRRYQPLWRLAASFIAPTGKLVAHNELIFDDLRRRKERVRFHDSGSLFNSARDPRAKAKDDDATALARELTQRLVGATTVGEPFRSRLSTLVEAKLGQIFRRTMTDMLSLRDADLPELLYGNSGGQYAARAMAIEILRRGGRTCFAAHAGSSVMVRMSDALAMREFAVASRFIVQTPALADQPEFVETQQLIAPIRHTEVDGGGGHRHILSLPLSRTRPAGKRPRLIYVSTLSRGFERSGVKTLPEVSYLDWQVRLARWLKTLPVELICKPHPGGYFKGRPHPIESDATASYAPFEDVMGEADVFLFDNCASTTMWEAVCTDRPIVYIDMDLFDFHQRIDPLFRKRCRVVRAHYDEQHRPWFDAHELREAILAPATPDSTDIRRLLTGE